MDYRKNFVKAMKAVAQMDQLLAKMDDVFKSYHRLVIAKGKGEIDQEFFGYKIQQLGEERKFIFKKYAQLAKQIEEIKDEFGGQIKE